MEANVICGGVRMEGLLLGGVLLAIYLTGDYIMKKIDRFINENR